MLFLWIIVIGLCVRDFDEGRRMKEVSYVSVFFSLIPLAVMYKLQADCTVWNTVLTCHETIPKRLPGGIQNVYITDFTDKYVGQGRFSHSSWRSVKLFDINANIETSLYISDFVFIGLKNITTLGIHARKGNIIHEKSFVGIDREEKLDFANMIALEPETLVIPLLYSTVLPNLCTLILENVNTEQGNVYFNFSLSFAHMLRFKNITNLSVRGTNVVLAPANANNISTVVQDLDVSNISFAFTTRFMWDITFPMLLNLNISNIVPRFFPGIRIVNRKFNYCNNSNSVFRRLEKIYANFILSDREIYVNNVTVDIYEPCLQMLRVLHARGNSIHFLNATLYVSAHFPLMELDLSFNSMKFLSAAALKGLINLENLYLGDNLLSSMSNYPDFKILFQPLYKLKRLSLANNKISYIPEDMFLHNVDLEWLNLRGNYLKSTSFLNLQPSKLTFLDISDNRITYLSGDDLITLQWISSRSKMQEILMTDNPFECSCESVNFIEWLNTKPVNANVQHSCYFGRERTMINEKSLAKAKFLCIKEFVYIASSVMSVLFVLALLFTMRYYRNKQRAIQLKCFLRNVYSPRQHEQFLCLLSYNHNDFDVSNKLYDLLESELKHITKCERDNVCIDFKHFRAGFPLVEEIMRCVSNSFVAVFVVSEAFCQSNWCCLEVREAYEQQKPIILIFVEEVSEENMSFQIRNIFKRYTRGKLVETEDGDLDFQPGGLQGLCDSLAVLASESRRNWRNVHDTFV